MSNHDDLLAGFLRKRHSVSKLVVHLIFTTKYRRKLFDSQMIAQLREAFGSAAAKLECEIIEMDGARPCTPAGCLPAKTGGQCDGQ